MFKKHRVVQDYISFKYTIKEKRFLRYLALIILLKILRAIRINYAIKMKIHNKNIKRSFVAIRAKIRFRL